MSWYHLRRPVRVRKGMLVSLAVPEFFFSISLLLTVTFLRAWKETEPRRWPWGGLCSNKTTIKHFWWFPSFHNRHIINANSANQSVPVSTKCNTAKKQIDGRSNSWPNRLALSSTEQWKATGKTELRKGSPRPSASASLSIKTELLCGKKPLMQVTKYSSTGITLDLKALLCTPSLEVSPGHEDVLQVTQVSPTQSWCSFWEIL